MVTDVNQPVRNTSCASCGAQVPIFSRASVQTICPFCRSTLVRTDMTWDSIGEMAALADDLSPFYVGLHGKYKTFNFTVIGRLQQQFDEGVWNEWLLQFANQRTRWLGEGSGSFYLTVPSASSDPLPEFKNLSLGKEILLEGNYYTVSNIENARCIATQGEIPFVATPGESAHLVDLTGADGSFASLDYSDDLPTLYIGKTISLSELEFEPRDGKPIEKKITEALRCSGCGNAVNLRNPESLFVACSSCGVANNISAGGKLVTAYSQTTAKLQLDIPLGSTGILHGRSYEVIGFLRLSGGGDMWEEYLLYNPTEGVRWLVCSQGHWSFVRTVPAPSLVTTKISYKSHTFKHFADYRSSVVAVLGEFYWQVKRGDSADCSDYICPPHVMSREKSKKEIVWSQGTYIDGSEIAAAFSSKKSVRRGVGINQPSPSILNYVAAFVVAVVLVMLVDIFVHPKIQTITLNEMAMPSTANTSELVSEPFVLKAPHSFFRVYANTDVRNNWVGLEYRLTNQESGETRIMNREVSYYSGYDSDGAWSEGGPSDSATLSNVLGGTYVLEVSGETAAGQRPDVRVRIQAAHGEGSSKNFWLIFWVLVLGPIIAGINKFYFEKRRWDASDHPWESE
ncbi:MAG: DUF4178 domain-containing protein [Gammaproteobacteria bacterium]|nr:MAG: DUF4178 domain-containing protein [Gammaproteobacteria bacterium]